MNTETCRVSSTWECYSKIIILVLILKILHDYFSLTIVFLQQSYYCFLTNCNKKSIDKHFCIQLWKNPLLHISFSHTIYYSAEMEAKRLLKGLYCLSAIFGTNFEYIICQNIFFESCINWLADWKKDKRF